MARKPVVPAAVADALTAEKPKAARVVQSLAPAPSDNADAPALAPVTLEELADKDVDTLTAEILTLETHGVAVVLEIGKRLIAVKDKLAHGDWLPWLERVNITPSYAQRYMRLAREWTNTTSMAYLGMTKMLALLALPEAERDDFIDQPHIVNGEEKSVNEMSVRQLQEAIEARKLAESQLYEAERRLRESDADNDQVRRELTLAQNRLEIAEVAKAKALAERDAEQQKRFAIADELEALKNKPIEVAVEKVADPEAIRKAKEEERESMQFLVDKANTERDISRQNCAKAQADLQAVTKERNDERLRANEAAQDLAQAKINFEQERQALKRAVAEAELKRADDAQHDLEVAQSDLAETKKELERVKAEAEQRAKASPIADTDLQKFAVLFEQVQASINQMHGITLKQPDDKREKLKNALLSLAEQIRKAAES